MVSTTSRNSLITVMEIPETHKMDQARSSPYFLSSTSLDVNVENLPPRPGSSIHLSVTTVLTYCKNKILNPYLRLLSVTGLRPLTIQQEPCVCLQILNHVYAIHVVVLLIAGYLLQYMACFRRDRGFCYKVPNDTFFLEAQLEQHERICHGPIIFSFVIPSAFHLIGYLYAVIIIRHSDDDQLPVLMERVFLSSTNLSNGLISQKKLVKTLWWFVGFTGFWMALSFISINVMMVDGNINFKWLETKPQCFLAALKVLMIICTLWHDIVQATIVSNYCLQTQLLTTYLGFLREKLLQSPIQTLEWIRHIENFKNMLAFINEKIAPSVSIFTLINLSWAISGIVWLFDYDHVDKETLPIMGVSILNIGLWLFISIAPFIQASKLTNSCDILRSAGQEVRTRPFVHQDTPGCELDSILLYTASLKLRAKLFWVPVTGKYLCLFFTLSLICILVLGQCHYLNLS